MGFQASQIDFDDVERTLKKSFDEDERYADGEQKRRRARDVRSVRRYVNASCLSQRPRPQLRALCRWSNHRTASTWGFSKHDI
jgi:hypothetical protein